MVDSGGGQCLYVGCHEHCRGGGPADCKKNF